MIEVTIILVGKSEPPKRLSIVLKTSATTISHEDKRNLLVDPFGPTILFPSILWTAL